MSEVQEHEAAVKTVVYLDPGQARWLRERQASALLEGRRLSASAIVREAIDQLRDASHAG